MSQKDKLFSASFCRRPLVSRTYGDSTQCTATLEVSTAERNMSVIFTLAEALIK